MFDWDDLKALLAVARGGSTLAAARALGVNQTTVGRRLESLEAALGLKLVERGQAGSRLTDAGRDLLLEAERVERAAEGFAHRAKSHLRGLAGAVRVTCSESIANQVVTPALPEFRRLYPDITVELVLTDRQLDLVAGEADIAVRGAVQLTDSNLVSRKLADFDFGLYCSADYAARRGVPAAAAELRDHALVVGDEALAMLPAMRWMLEQAPGAEIACRSNTLTNLMQAVRSGVGIGPMPCLSADIDPDLVQVHPPVPEALSTAWLLTTPGLKDVPRVRAFIDFIVPHFHGLKRQFEQKAAELKGAREVAHA